MDNKNEKISDMMKNYDDCLVPSEVMKVLRVSKNTLYKMLEDGYIESYKVYGNYRIPKQCVIEYILRYGYVNSNQANENRRKVIYYCSKNPKSASEIAMHIGISVGYCKNVLLQGLINSGKLKLVKETNKSPYLYASVALRKLGKKV